MNKTIARKIVFNPPQLYNIDFKSKYFELLNNIISLEKENALWQNAFEQIEDIYNNAPSGFHSLDENGYFIHINNTQLAWLGYSREELVGKKKLIDIISDESRKMFFKKFPAFKKSGNISGLEIEFLCKDGSSFPGLISSNAVFDKEGKFKMSRTIVFNITDRKLLEEQFQKKNEELNIANEKLSLVNKEKDRFIGIASHDLQNPLVAINLLSKILLRDEINDPVKLKELYGGILQASVQMNDLIKNYLNVTRIETGSVILNIMPIDIKLLTNQIISRYLEIAQRKNITIYFSPTKNFILDTDSQCFTQIFENLISNAIKYTPRGKNIFVKIYSKGDFINIQIEDEGVGIKKNELPMLYDKFQKISSKPTDGESSTGLGLNIVKFLVDQLNGLIKVKSTIGRGTTFTVSFRKGYFLYSSLK